MSVALYLELVNYEGKNVYQDVLLEHIDDVQSLLKRCESLKIYDVNLNKSMPIPLQDPIEDKERNPDKSAITKLATKISKLSFASVKQYIDECNGFETYEKPSFNPYEELNFKLWDLFSLSACSDHLLWLWQQGELTIDEYSRFFTEVGVQVLSTQHSYYHPFYHEIYYVDDETKIGEQEQIVIKEQLYPMVMFGDLQFSRAGVIIYNHPSIDENLAKNSDIYFVNRRNNRKCHDLSHGWGHNSRWRTDFVRNYETSSEWKFNVDGKVDLSDSEAYAQYWEQSKEDVSITAAKELLVNRHFIHPNNTSPEIQSDLFPYNWRIDIGKADFNYIKWIQKMGLPDNN